MTYVYVPNQKMNGNVLKLMNESMFLQKSIDAFYIVLLGSKQAKSSKSFPPKSWIISSNNMWVFNSFHPPGQFLSPN